MIILTLRCDKPEAEVGLWQDDKRIAYETWQAHRELSNSIHIKVNDLLKHQKLAWNSIEGVAFYEGPGSFTGLRIGASIATSLGLSLQVPIISTGTDNWIEVGVQRIMAGQSQPAAIPLYGSEANITAPGQNK